MQVVDVVLAALVGPVEDFPASHTWHVDPIADESL